MTQTTAKASTPSVMVSLFAYGDIKADMLQPLMDTVAHIMRGQRPVQFSTIREDALICRSRSRELAKFLLSNLDVWVLLDHDIHYDPTDLFALADLAHSKRKPICVPYSKRALPPQPAIRTLPDHPLPPAGVDALTEINAFTTGFLAIPRHCLEDTVPTLLDPSSPVPLRIYQCRDVSSHAFAPSFPSLFQPFPLDTAANGQFEYLSEDYAASVRLKACGHEPYAWSKPILGHISNFAYKLPTTALVSNA